MESRAFHQRGERERGRGRGRGAKKGRKKRAIERESGGQSVVFSPSSELVKGQGKAGWDDDDDDDDHGCFSSLSLSRGSIDTRLDVTRWLLVEPGELWQSSGLPRTPFFQERGT